MGVTTAEQYVTAAYLVFLGIVLLYVVIYSTKIGRLEREVSELAAQPGSAVDPVETEAAGKQAVA